METIQEKVSTNEVDRKPLSSDSMRVRCPHCRKLYLVQMADIREAKPKFECVQCNTRFWLAMENVDISADVIGHRMQEKSALVNPAQTPTPAAKPSVTPAKFKLNSKSSIATETKPCPKCFKLVDLKADECRHCGVLLSKVKELEMKEALPKHSNALAQAWQKVIADYGSESLHSEFIRMAQKENSLAYAAGQYGQLSKLMPGDETTRRYVREVQALAVMMLPEAKPVSKIVGRAWQIPLAVSLLMVGVGIFLPVLRNMIGVGAALLFITLALLSQQFKKN